ncbi:ROK family transcriptional regulator [Bhargavaea beijingensis]|uniref:ROK family transcriptional regulator n=1 Tax=Bhargavaea beijingensis TaxID=426756 RepID=A0A1G6Z2V7_9BACL|nr:ROK family transcriptional regulator [Bhargavaea beijingensis]MCW1929584.1 ROK family transcriptional regulator [Bhargavaea beijingensis]RSK36540.1 ROK family transcriptional regulator [Bhargavaea beijingensis]SDD96287.1 Winged helix-turn-helix DNA-binding [Bhargavaea beijingensis]
MQYVNDESNINRNARQVLRCVLETEPTTRTAIAKKLSLSKPTVSAAITRLIDEGWVTETGSGEASASGGRKPVNLMFNPKKARCIGIDIGGTKVAVGITDLKGELESYRTFPTQQYLNEDFFPAIRRMTEDMMMELSLEKEEILGIGAGIPGVTNVQTGIVEEAPALKWRDYPVREKLEEVFPYPVYVDNDVNIGVLGEHWTGRGKGKQNLIYIAIGTGIGSGIILNGQLFRGSHYSAGELGYMVTDRNLAKTYRPSYEGYGFLESVAGGTSVGTALSERLDREVTAAEAFNLYRSGDRDAAEILGNVLEQLGIAVANYVSLLNPEMIILGGGLSQSFDVIQPIVSDNVKRYAPKECEIVKTAFGQEAGVIGAVALLLKEHEGLYNI